MEVGAVLEGYMNVLRKSAENTTEQNLTLQLNIISKCDSISCYSPQTCVHTGDTDTDKEKVTP